MDFTLGVGGCQSRECCRETRISNILKSQTHVSSKIQSSSRLSIFILAVEECLPCLTNVEWMYGYTSVHVTRRDAHPRAPYVNEDYMNDEHNLSSVSA